MKTNESFDEKSKTHDSLNEARIEESPEKSKAEDSLSLSNILKGSKRSKGVLNECDSYDFRNSIPQLIQAMKSNQKLRTPSKKIKTFQDFDKTKTLQIKGKKGKLYEQICPICLGQFDKVKAILSCKHKFCFFCLNEWSKSSTICPCCRKPFQEIQKRNEEIKQSQKIKVQQKVLEYEEGDEFICYNCHRGDNQHVLLVCDSCDFYCCHIYCDVKLLDNIPEGDWYCKYCEDIMNRRQNPMDLSVSTVFSQQSSSKSLDRSSNKPIANRTRAKTNDESSVRVLVRLRRRV